MIRVLVAIEIPLLGDIVETIINNSNNIKVIGRSRTVRETLRQVEACDVALISAILSGNGTFELIQKIAVEYPNVKRLVTGLPKSIPIILSCFEAGASGYVLKTEPGEMLLKKIQAVYDNRPIICPGVAAALIDRVAELAKFRDAHEKKV